MVKERQDVTWPVKKENNLTLQRAEMTMIKWMCGVNRQVFK